MLERQLKGTKEKLELVKEQNERIGHIARKGAARNVNRVLKSAMLTALSHWRQVTREERRFGRLIRIIESVRGKYVRYLRNAAIMPAWARWKQFAKDSKAQRSRDREAALLQQIRALKSRIDIMERLENQRLKAMRKAAERAFRRFKHHTQWRAFSAWKWVVDLMHYTAELRRRVEAKLGALRAIVKPLEDEVA